MVRRAGMLVVGVMLLFCGRAQAGTYEVWSCADAAGNPAPTEGWVARVAQLPGIEYANHCAARSGLYVGVDGSAVTDGASGAWLYTAPSDTTFESIRLWRSLITNQASVNRMYESIGVDPVPPGYGLREVCETPSGCFGLGMDSAPFGDANLLRIANVPAGATRLSLEVRCNTSQPTCAATAGGPQIAARIFRMAALLRDDVAPTLLSPPAGSLTGGGTLSGVQSVAFSAADRGSGIRYAELELDGGTALAAKGFGCEPPYVHLQPCKPAEGGTLAFDTATLPDGEHTARVLVHDATGTNTTRSEPIRFVTANSPTACAPDAAPSFALPRSRTIGFGGKLTLRGTLGGVPAGTPLLVNSQVDRPGAPARFGRTPVTVDAAGRFAYRVPAGSSRTLRFAQRVPGALTYACSAPLKVNVKASATLKASPRSIRSGQRVRFTGRLRGGYVPGGGKVIELQAHERGRWRSITSLRTDAHGAFSYRYRFSFRAARTTFPVRVRVRHEGTYPFALGYSKRVRVRVR